MRNLCCRLDMANGFSRSASETLSDKTIFPTHFNTTIMFIKGTLFAVCAVIAQEALPQPSSASNSTIVAAASFEQVAAPAPTLAYNVSTAWSNSSTDGATVYRSTQSAIATSVSGPLLTESSNPRVTRAATTPATSTSSASKASCPAFLLLAFTYVQYFSAS